MRLKSKMYLAAMALPAIFASCTQDEVFSGLENQDATKGRAVVGQVTLVMDNAETRYDSENGRFEAGKDVLGMYLMDEYQSSWNGGADFDCPGEHNNANDEWWKYQDHWNAMYKLVNYIQTNYPFRYTADETSRSGAAVWKNDAKLVEGNYFSMYPQQEHATNRRELWHYINPAVQMVKHSTKEAVYHGVDNQFFLGYNQIYRNDDANANGELTVNVKLTGVMAGYKIKLLGWQGADVKLEKISFKSTVGKALPTIAYIEPAQSAEWRQVTDDVVVTEDSENCTTHTASGLYDAEKTWTKKTVRSLVNYCTTENGRIPYGLDEDKQGLAYEYSFAFPENTILKGDVSNGDLAYAYIMVPTMTSDQWENIVVDIYGWRWIKDYDYPEGGYWEYGKFENNVNSEAWFDPQSLQPWNSNEYEYYQNIEVRFDDLAFKAVHSFDVASTADMEQMVRGFLQQTSGSKDIEFTIRPDAGGIEITEDFKKMLIKDSKNKIRNITVTFDGEQRNGVVNFNVDNTLALHSVTTETGKKVVFKYAGGIVLNNNAIQTVAEGTTLDGQFTINNNKTLNVEGELGDNVLVNNYNVLTVKGEVKNIVNNHNDLTIDGGTIGKVVNNGIAISNGGKVAEFENNVKTTCNDCNGKLNVDKGTLEITTLTNNSEVNVMSGAVLKTANGNDSTPSFINNYKVVNVGTIESNNIQNNAEVENLGKIVAKCLNNGSTSNNAAVINNGNTDVAGVIEGGYIYNRGAVYANKGDIATLQNLNGYGILYVTAEEGNEVKTTTTSAGEIRFMSVAPQHIGTNGNDVRIFVTSAEDDADRSMLNIMKSMYLTGSTHVETASDITFDYYGQNVANDMTAVKFATEEIKSITVQGEKVNFQGAVTGNTYSFTVATLYNEAELHIENATKITVDSVENTGTIHCGTNSSISDKDGVVVDHN